MSKKRKKIPQNTLVGSGTQNAALSFGGYTSGNSTSGNSANSSTWTTVGSLSVPRSQLVGSSTHRLTKEQIEKIKLEAKIQKELKEFDRLLEEAISEA
jgi:hypothetical protein